MMQEFMPHGSGNLVTMFDREIGLHGDINIGQQPMPYPSDPHLSNF